MLHENRDLAGDDLSWVIKAAAVAFASQHLHRLIIHDLCSLSIDALCHAKALSRLAYHFSRM